MTRYSLYRIGTGARAWCWVVSVSLEAQDVTGVGRYTALSTVKTRLITACRESTAAEGFAAALSHGFFIVCLLGLSYTGYCCFLSCQSYWFILLVK